MPQKWIILSPVVIELASKQKRESMPTRGKHKRIQTHKEKGGLQKSRILYSGLGQFLKVINDASRLQKWPNYKVRGETEIRVGQSRT